MKSRIAVVCAAPLFAFFAFNCSVPDFCEGAACGVQDAGDSDALVSRDSSADGPVGDGSKPLDAAPTDGAAEGGPPVCNPAADPKDSPACVVDAEGIFVDANGSDASPGTSTQPVKTIGTGISLAQGSRGRVYVCAGSYSEAVALTTSVSIYGGFACGTYAYTGVLPVVTAPGGSQALTVTGASNVTIEDMQWVSPDATGTDGNGGGMSSIAASLANDPGLTVKRCAFQAGAGAAAVNGSTTGDTYAASAPGGLAGTATGGGADVAQTCTNGSGTTDSGKGGGPSSGGSNGTMGTSDPAISPAYPDDGNHDGAKGTNCGSGSAHAGSYGLAGTAGLAATTAGKLAATGWMPSAGGIGVAGGVGQGGGGGASTDATGGGGSGSPGGCGGDGGKGGAGGGASIGLVVYQSTVSLSSSTLVVTTGGAGGSGSKGGTGQSVSGGGSGAGLACQGGAGGYGGSGGGGAGGTGGISVGIAWTGTAPTLDGTLTPTAPALAGVTLPSSAAAGGGGGAGGDAVATMARGGQTGATGAAGVAQAVLGL